MPRRGEYKKGFPARRPEAAQPQRIGPRQMIAADLRGHKSAVVLDPAEFRCSQLAAELADEWVELAEAARYKIGTCQGYRRSIRDFCTHVDATVPQAEAASLSRAVPDVHHAAMEWIRLLPATYPTGSRGPAWSAGRLRALIARRVEHPDRAVISPLDGWVKGALGIRRGETQEIDEFTLADKKKLVQAAWTDAIEVEKRIRRGWALARTGTDPETGGWMEPANLLWAIAHNAWSCEEIARRLPTFAKWSPALRALVPSDLRSNVARRDLLQVLVRMLYPHNLDLQSFRILLMAATGRAPEEVVMLDDDDIEYGTNSVMIDFSKGRARAEHRRSFSTDPAAATEILHPSRPRLDAADLTRRLLELSRPMAEQVGITPVPLFLRAAVRTHTLAIGLFAGDGAGAAFGDWLEAHDVTVEGPCDIRRLRKSGKVEKAIAFKGRISDIADDHTAATFRSHYAHGTTLRVIAGKVITGAQQHWLTQAMKGPVLLSQEAEDSLTEPATAAALGLSAEDVEQLRAGEMDMGVSSCRDPFTSPFGRPGQLCPVAPTRCLECRNAFVLPSNLPQLILFSAHLAQLQLRLHPTHFHALWGQSAANVTEALKHRTDAEIAQARQLIADEGLSLQLPLASQVEFDA